MVTVTGLCISMGGVFSKRTTDKNVPAPNEQRPLCVTQKKCAIVRPHYNNDDACTFDGKIGMWPFIGRKAARIDQQQEQFKHNQS
jgi:hypothetical protein